MAAVLVFTVGHERTVTRPQTVARTRAEGAEAGLSPASFCFDLKMQPVSAGAPLPLLVLHRGGSDEVCAAGPLLHREEECAVIMTVCCIAPVLLSVTVFALLPHNTKTPIQEAFVPLQ